MTRRQSKVFINYRNSDEPWAAAALDDALGRRWGEDSVFLDYRSIVAGQLFDNEILSNLRRSTVLLVVIGARWLSVQDGHGRRLIDGQHDWVRLEIAEAFTYGIATVPVLIGEIAPLSPAALPSSIRRLAQCQYARLRHRHRHQDLEELVHNLLALDPRLARPNTTGMAG